MAAPAQRPRLLPLRLAFVAVTMRAVRAAIATEESQQTAWQKALLERTEDEAARWSAAATAALESRLDGPELRSQLQRCGVPPEISELSAHDLLLRIRDEVAVAEVVSGFKAVPHKYGLNYTYIGQTVRDGLEGPSFFQNIWEASLKHKIRDDYWFPTVDGTEMKLYGMKPFSVLGSPANLSEARERSVYCLVNLHKVDAGSPFYGDISAVFSPKGAGSKSIISAVDTGSWTELCDKPIEHPHFEVNCSALPPNQTFPLGTMRHFNHLFLLSEDYWGQGTLGRTLCRLLGPWGHSLVEAMDLVKYWEAMPLTQLPFPSAVKMLIGNFPRLFGTDLGEQLRRWCQESGWVLLWTLGLNMDDFDPFFWDAPMLPDLFVANQRLADPKVLAASSAAHNMSLDARSPAVVSFQEAWSQVALVRTMAEAEHRILSNSTWAEMWYDLSQALPDRLRLAPLRAGSCADADACVGTSPAGHCVCYAPEAGSGFLSAFAGFV